MHSVIRIQKKRAQNRLKYIIWINSTMKSKAPFHIYASIPVKDCGVNEMDALPAFGWY